MATFRGRDGAVEVGTTNVLALQSWSWSGSVGLIEKDSMGDVAMTRVVDIADCSGDIVYFEDDTTSANGQTSLVQGASVTLRFYSQGEGTGKTYRTGPAIISEISAPVSKGEMVTVTASWVGNGVWSTATVGA